MLVRAKVQSTSRSRINRLTEIPCKFSPERHWGSYGFSIFDHHCALILVTNFKWGIIYRVLVLRPGSFDSLGGVDSDWGHRSRPVKIGRTENGPSVPTCAHTDVLKMIVISDLVYALMLSSRSKCDEHLPYILSMCPFHISTLRPS